MRSRRQEDAMTARILCALFLAVSAAQCQSPTQYQNAYATVMGNSIAHFQANFATQEFPAIPAANVWIWGTDSATCAYFLQSNGVGLPLILYYVPARTTVLVLIDSTNDVMTGVTVAQHMACIEQTVSALLGRNPALKIVVANTPPITHWNPCTGTYRDDTLVQTIENYNAAYADPVTGLQALWPNNLRVADVFTPSAQQDGWGVPADLTGPCGVHPGQEFQWSASWQHFAFGYEPLVMSAVNGLW